ncbi:hypothetical protein B0H16DRAFT_1732069 [Mycena metata]|uniref:Uncharacterized protein n=1 Tax=Mycena metata TaxID=1033252 RepID=A0AAD7I345_9AGAR|nr:hypothetical protein B0H16DRAFT_1732069 [Mycena metata]
MRSPFFLFLRVLIIPTFLVGIAQGVPLVPFKNSPTLLARSTWTREVVPKNLVTLSYAPPSAHYSTSSLTFAAHPNVPILLLEDIQFLVNSVVCHAEADGSVVEIAFNSDDAYAATFAAWSSLSQFMLVTSHPSCNPSDERGAWLVSSVAGDGTESEIILQARTVPVREMGSSFRISHVAGGVSTAWGSPDSLFRRDIYSDKVFELNKSFDFAPRQQILPVDINLGNNSLLSYALLLFHVPTYAHPSDKLPSTLVSDDIPDPAGLQVFCVDCVSVSKFAVGLEINVTNLQLARSYINITVQDFHHDIQLEFSLNDTAQYEKTLDVLLLAIPDLEINVPDIVTVGFLYGAAVRMEMDVSTNNLNFTVGASASIPSGAEATFMISQFNQSTETGWSQSTFDIHPFRLNGGSFEATAGISLSPFLEATLKIGPDNVDLFSATARLYVNTPHVTGAASVATNVTRSCQTPGINDYETFTTALTFGAGLNISIDLSGNGSFIDDTDTTIFTNGLAFGEFPTLAAPKCMVVADDTSTASLAGQVVAPTGTLLAAAAAIPSFNIAGIQSYYSAHGALPTNVNYTQMLMATTVPDNIKKAVQKAGAQGLHAMLSLVSVSAAVAFGGAFVLLF